MPAKTAKASAPVKKGPKTAAAAPKKTTAKAAGQRKGPVPPQGGRKTMTKAAKKSAPATAVKAVKVVKVAKRKAYTRPQFRRPHTYRRPVTVKPSNFRAATATKWDAFRTICYPLTTDKAMKKIEENNTLTFIVDSHANKTEIKKAIRKLYQVKAVKVNTLIRPDGLKKAYIRLSASHDALETANKMGLL